MIFLLCWRKRAMQSLKACKLLVNWMVKWRQITIYRKKARLRQRFFQNDINKKLAQFTVFVIIRSIVIFFHYSTAPITDKDTT